MLTSDRIVDCKAALYCMVVQLVIVMIVEFQRSAEGTAVSTMRRKSLKLMSSTPLHSDPSSADLSLVSTSGMSGFKLDLDELQKRGLSPDDVLNYIRLLAEGKMSVDGTCLHGDALISEERRFQRNKVPAQAPLSSRLSIQSTTVVGQERGELERKFLRNRTITCNDGSKSGYYIRKSSSGSRRWLVFLEGGWLCFDRKSCEGRWLNTPHLMSSDSWTLTRRGSGILSIDPTENPFIHDGNIVLVPYCSSDSWSGTYKPSKRGDFSFLGSLIIEEVFKELGQWHGLADASDVFLAGSSAGGTGVLVNLDRIAQIVSRLTHGAVVRGIVDSGWFLDNKPLHPIECTDAHLCSPSESVRRGLQLWHGLVPENCRNIYPKSEHWRCYFGYRLYSSLQTVVFVVQYLFDEAQITADNVGPPVQRQQWRYIHDLGVDVRLTLSNVSAVFAPSCLSHMLITRSEWRHVTIDGCSLPEALQCWESGGTNEKNHYFQRKQILTDHLYESNHASRPDFQIEPIPKLLTGYNNRKYVERSQVDKPFDRSNKLKDGAFNKRIAKHRIRHQNRHYKRARQFHTNDSSETAASDNYHAFIEHASTTQASASAEVNTSHHPQTQHQSASIGSTTIKRGRPRGNSEYGRNRRRRKSSSGPSSSVKVKGIHEIHHDQQHAGHNRCCGHRRIERCSWPQCNASCPRVRNPFTGEEIDLVELLTVQLGVDVSALAESIGLDRNSVRNMNHSELIRLLVGSS